MPEWTIPITRTFSENLGEGAAGILAGIVILLVGFFVAGWAAKLVGTLCKRSERVDETVTRLLVRTTRLLVITFTLLIALEELGFDTTSIIAFLGAMGLAVGLALKDTIADLAGGIIISILRPIGVGEAGEVAGVLGTIDEIGLFDTRMTTFDGVPVVLPNSKVRGSPIKNFSRAKERRIDLTIGVAYEADVDRAIEIVKGLLEAEPRIKDDPPILINVTELADSSVNLLVRGWTAPADFFDTKLDLTRAIKLALDQADIEIPYPKRSITVTKDVA